MSRKSKLFQHLLDKPKDLRFKELEKIILWCGYTRERTRGSHAHYFKEGYPPLTIPTHSPVKSYLIRQVRKLMADISEDLTQEGE